jgi:tRNA(fMet)-specific endonuclease VapC
VRNRGGRSPVINSLLDTGILSEIIKGYDHVVAGNVAAYRQSYGHYTPSAITVMEIVQGFQKNRSFGRLQAFISSLATEEVIALDEAEGELAGRIAGELERQGRPIGTADLMIAAIALEHGLELITGNTAHFQLVHQLGYPLTLANWRI